MHIISFIDILMQVQPTTCPVDSSSINNIFPFGFFVGNAPQSSSTVGEFVINNIHVSTEIVSDFISSVKWAILFRFILSMLLSL